MKISVIGTGYVGLVSGTCFAQMGNSVTCVDIDQGKIDKLSQGIIPIYEPGLEDMVLENYAKETLKFTVDIQNAITSTSIAFIAVGTPMGEDGSADLQYVLAVAKSIGQHMQSYMVIVDKSTVPVGTAEKVRAAIQTELDARGSDLTFDVVSNPEFLKEGAAIKDFMHPDRVVIGADSEKAMKVIKARVYDAAQQEAQAEYAASRKSAVGTGDRSERIRTYNFPQNRVTDHRIGLTIQKLDQIIEGKLDDVIDALIMEEQAYRLESLDRHD